MLPASIKNQNNNKDKEELEEYKKKVDEALEKEKDARINEMNWAEGLLNDAKNKVRVVRLYEQHK